MNCLTVTVPCSISSLMGTEQLYFVIGFLLGTMLTGCLVVFAYALWHEYLFKPQQEDHNAN